MTCTKLEKFRSQIESETGEKLIFQKEWGKRWSRIYFEKNEGKFTEDLKEWAVCIFRLMPTTISD
jgi:hypothetical protein